MKKQIFILMLNATIFMTSPLFSMEPSENEEMGRTPLLCPVCKLDSSLVIGFPEVEQTALFPVDSMRNIGLHCSFKSMLDFSTTSKANYNLFQDPILWQQLAEKYDFVPKPEFKKCIKSILCIKSRLLPELALFKHSGITGSYKISAEQWALMKKTPCKTTWSPCGYATPLASYRFSIGPDQFEMCVYPQPKVHYRLETILKKKNYLTCEGFDGHLNFPRSRVYIKRLTPMAPLLSSLSFAELHSIRY